MDQSWTYKIRDTGKVTVYNGIDSGKWANIFKASLDAFNHNARLPVKLIPGEDKEQANIVMQVSGGSAGYTYDGQSYSVNFDGTLAHGKTNTLAREDGIEKAFIFLPLNTTQSHTNVLQFIAVHELIHACGLVEHNNDGVFMTAPNIQNGNIWSAKNSKKMPPLFFAPKTVARLQGLWGKSTK